MLTRLTRLAAKLLTVSNYRFIRVQYRIRLLLLLLYILFRVSHRCFENRHVKQTVCCLYNITEVNANFTSKQIINYELM
jgi:hypothetical protein